MVVGPRFLKVDDHVIQLGHPLGTPVVLRFLLLIAAADVACLAGLGEPRTARCVFVHLADVQNELGAEAADR